MTYLPLDKVRAEQMGELYLGGLTLQAIGDRYGVSRERVRQILRFTGVPARKSATPEDVLAMAMKASGIVEAADLAGCAQITVRTRLESLGVYAQVKQAWRKRRAGRRVLWTRERLIERMQEIAVLVGRTPTTRDLNRLKPSATTFQKRFGSLQAAQAAAGLEPRGPGMQLSRQYHSTNTEEEG